MTGAVLPGHLRRVSHRIDYLGSLLLAGSATSLIIFASLGGISWAWVSVPSVFTAALGVVLAVAFLLAERGAAEPVIPLKLFRERVFNAASSIGFVMGFAMFGALTFLPLYMQIVKGVSPTASGLRILPLMLGMLGASVTSGRLVTRWGRYRIFPIVGTALMTVGAYLLSMIDASTNGWVLAGYMFVFGVGMGLVMQVLVVAVQNAVSYEDLGVATSSATFFRMIGGSFGTAVFGAIYAIVLNHTIAPTLAKIPASVLRNFNPQTINPAVLAKLKSTAEGLFFYTKYIDAVTHSIQIVFLVAVPIAFVAFLLSFLLPEVELRKTVQTVDVGEVNGMPDHRSSLQEIELALHRLSDRENRVELYQTLAQRAGIDLPPRAVWLLYRLADQPACTVNDVAQRLKVEAGADSARGGRPRGGRHGRGAAAGRDECDLYLTAAGTAALDKLTEARRRGLTELLEGWNPEEHPEIIEMVKDLAHSLLADDERLVADAMPQRGGGRVGGRPGGGGGARRGRPEARRPVSVVTPRRWCPPAGRPQRPAERATAELAGAPSASRPMSAAPSTGGASRRTRTARGAAAWTPAATRAWKAVSVVSKMPPPRTTSTASSCRSSRTTAARTKATISSASVSAASRAGPSPSAAASRRTRASSKSRA